jgi:hypothetical protein
VFRLFKKKLPSKPNIVYIFIRFNVAGIRNWLANKGEIPANKRWVNDTEVEVRTIYYFPESDLHYHKNCNQFSHALGGIDDLPGEIGSVEWFIWNNYFTVVLEDHTRETIFTCPLNHVTSMIATGSTASTGVPLGFEGRQLNFDTEEYNLPEHCRRLHLSNEINDITYANALFMLSVQLPKAGHTTFYDER